MQDGGNILVFFSHWWDLEQYQQIIERIGPTRQIQAGHNRPVFIHHIIAADTMDEMVMERRNSKRTVQDILLDAMKKRYSMSEQPDDLLTPDECMPEVGRPEDVMRLEYKAPASRRTGPHPFQRKSGSL
jgi:SNF2 family DNA or RNA helicase